jgi:cobaltochelatase CobS
LTEDAGRLVKPHELFRFAATANSKGQGDEYGIYAGVRPMNMAMLDRFPVFLEVDYLQETEEDGLLKRTFPNLSETVRNQMCSYAKLIREAFKNGEISLTLSPRGLLAMGEFYTFYEGVMPTAKKALDTAVEMTTIDKAADDNVQRVRELANRAFG